MVKTQEKHPAPPFVFRYRFRCIECGNCCRWQGQVRLTDADIARLAEGLDVTEEDFIEQYTEVATPRQSLRLTDRSAGSCIFLRGNRCSVYSHRPDQCRRFPFPSTSHSECPGLAVDCQFGDEQRR